ncbi:hypothetical protein [Aquimarina pacifica]|uniref:hypothetical protein n=1 Tax=Aquimarina pacifica TaxID=1296415 RepID=UPI000472B863|nr:hypothetical protein [Aquimarina pacifica]
MLRILFLGVLFISVFTSNAQGKINDYKYVIVPESYGFFEESDKYQLNSLTKFLFNKYGFSAYMQGEEFPKDFSGCNALRANLIRQSGMFLTKLLVELKDCNDKVVFTSQEGKSREKEYKNAYHEALRDAFRSIKGLNYAYSGYKGDTSSATGQPQKAVVVSEQKQQQKQQQVTESPKQPEVSVPNTTGTEVKSTTYSLNDVLYVLKKQEYGYLLYDKETSAELGKLFKSSNGKSYIVKAGDLSGTGYFDAYGNFILERVNPATNQLIVDTLARQ